MEPLILSPTMYFFGLACAPLVIKCASPRTPQDPQDPQDHWTGRETRSALSEKAGGSSPQIPASTFPPLAVVAASLARPSTDGVSLV